MIPEIQITKKKFVLAKIIFLEIQKYNYRNTEIPITEIHKHKLHKYMNANDRNT